MVKMPNLTKELGLDKPFLDSEQSRQLFETYEIVKEILNSSDKAAVWMITNNPHLGNAAPFDLVLMGRGHKVLKFVQNAQDENRDPFEDGDVV